jgi:hypothetical protein
MTGRDHSKAVPKNVAEPNFSRIAKNAGNAFFAGKCGADCAELFVVKL